MMMNEQPQDAMQQDQAEHGLAQQEYDDTLRQIVRYIFEVTYLSSNQQKFLCGALKIDVRDVM